MRETVGAMTLEGLVAEVVASKSECADCIIGKVIEVPRDGTGCNWRIAVVEGSGCFACLEAIGPLIRPLQERYALGPPDDEASLLTTWALHR